MHTEVTGTVILLLKWPSYCSCKLKHVVKFHCQVYMLMFMSKEKYARVKLSSHEQCLFGKVALLQKNMLV